MRALRDQVRVQDRMHLILKPRAMPHDLVAPRHQPALAFGLRVRRPDLRQVPRRVQTGERAGIDLVGLYVSLGDRLHLQRIGSRNGARTRDTAMLLAVASTTTSSPSSAVRVISMRPACRSLPFSQNTTSRKFGGRRCQSPVAFAPPVRHMTGSCGRHDNYGFALSAQPGESQRRPATNSSSRLIVCIGLPALRAPGAAVPMVAPYATM
jgi:hypothetical protein